MDAAEIALLGDSLRGTMNRCRGSELDAALREFGWLDLLRESPDTAIPVVFGLLGETGSHAPVLNDVIAHAAGRQLPATVPMPYAGGRWVRWEREAGAGTDADALDPELPLHTVASGETLPIAEARRALSWWLVGTSRTMLDLARRHALDRVQFGRPISSHQAVRHRLAETLVAIEGAEATLATAHDDLGALLAKAAAGQAARTASRNCQQVMGGIGFTAEHDLHNHVRRALVLDGLLGSGYELTREAGAWVRSHQSAPRLAQL
ncbi:MAG: acyl-CoA dehydrogenase [Nocardia sp.]|nr:acyl-CoA dehydrogenase [Nocardia sp.]